MSDLFEPFAGGLSVSRIATPREQLATCRPTDQLEHVLAQNQEGYDHIPVVDDDGVIVGTVKTSSSRVRETTARDCMDPLSSNHIIGEDSAIVDFIRQMQVQPFRYTVGPDGVAGLVTWADTQKLAARAALFALVTQLELCMIEAIKREFDGDTCIERLSENHRNKLYQTMHDAKERDTFVGTVPYTQFCDKRQILMALYGGKPFSNALEEVEGLRNYLAHANEYVREREDAKSLAALVGSIEDMILRLAKPADRE